MYYSNLIIIFYLGSRVTDEPLADSKLVYFTVEGDIAHQVYAQPAHKAGQTFLKFYFPKQDIAGWVVPARKHWGLISEDDIEVDQKFEKYFGYLR